MFLYIKYWINYLRDDRIDGYIDLRMNQVVGEINLNRGVLANL